MADKDWGADFRKLSAGAALVGLTLWLDHMQAMFSFKSLYSMTVSQTKKTCSSSLKLHIFYIRILFQLGGFVN